MEVRFEGAADRVTGSLHVVKAAGQLLLLDCGMIQGSDAEEALNLAPFGFDVGAIDAVVISHAHIDHIGRLPLLVARGYRGPVYAQAATADLMPIMLMDAASLQESDADRRNRHRRDGEAEVAPLYTREDVQETLSLLRTLDYHQRAEILPGITINLLDAGHILGSCIVEVFADGRKLVFSGDLGPKGTPIIRDAENPQAADQLLMESTYGDRDHRDRAETIRELGGILDAAWKDGGNVLIPAFAVGRSQELLYWFARHWDEWQMSRWRIFLDSPMAGKVVKVYDHHHELFDADAVGVWKGTPNPFRLPNLHLTESVDESMAINRIRNGAIVIAGNGMASGGRILHHFRHNLDRREVHVVFVGYQAQNTLGRRLVNGAKSVRIHGDEIRVNAQMHTVGGLSAHVDRSGLLEWYGAFEPRPRALLVHGEDDARNALAAEMHQRFGTDVGLARPGEVVRV